MAIEIRITHGIKNLSGRELFSFYNIWLSKHIFSPVDGSACLRLEEITFEDLSEIQQSELNRNCWDHILQDLFGVLHCSQSRAGNVL